VSEVVLEELSGRDWTNVPIFLPTADIGRDALAQGLARFGARVERVAAYRTVTPENVGALAREALEQRLDVVTFTSSSTVRNLLGALDGDGSGLKSSIIACIGPATAATARELGLHVDLVAERHTVEGLVEALVRYFASV
jgi:uroporphyrinogen-III synthase